MKKITAVFLSLIVMFNFMPIAHAQTNDDPVELITISENSIVIQSEDFTVERIGNKIYLDGELVATILTEETSSIQPRTGWVYTETRPYGSSDSEYSRNVDTLRKNIQLERTLAGISAFILASILQLTIWPNGPASIFLGAATTIIASLPGTQYGDLKTLYFTENIKAHNVLPSYYRMNTLTFYYDSAYTQYAARDVLYSWWG